MTMMTIMAKMSMMTMKTLMTMMTMMIIMTMKTMMKIMTIMTIKKIMTMTTVMRIMSMMTQASKKGNFSIYFKQFNHCFPQTLVFFLILHIVQLQTDHKQCVFKLGCAVGMVKI